jgi:Predicted polymerase, most proteins contain PALM domain, HD hydrolase domain and Zn-ribbon domain
MKILKMLKEKFIRAKKEESKEEESKEPLFEEAKQDFATTSTASSVSLELSHEHPLYRLYDIRTDKSRNTPPPELVMKGCDDLTEDQLRKELMRFRIEMTKAADFRLKDVLPKITEGESEEEESETPHLEPSMDALPFIYVSSDRMYAWVLVFPPTGWGKELTKELIFEALEKKKVSYGLVQETFDSLPDDYNRYFHLFLIAKGSKPANGDNGYLVDYFLRHVERLPEMDEFGNVNYMSLGAEQNVKKGDLICEAIPPTEGIAGRTVLNQELRCKNGKSVSIPKGKNTEVSEDGNKLIASIDGRVEFSGRYFSVKPLLEIPGNVDYSTGNINFIGDVLIHGDVCSGFSVKAMGDIKVDGVIESCEIEAGGDLIVVKGIVGNMETIVRSQHNIYSKYLVNSIVHARQNVHTDSIRYSNVYSDGEVQVCSGRGLIVGGQIRAAQGIEAKIVGSVYESPTSVFLGGQPYANFEKQLLSRNIKEMKDEMEKLERQPDSPYKSKQMSKLRLELSVSGMKLNKFDRDKDRMEEEGEELKNCRLRCGTAHPRVSITIEDETVILDRTYNSCNARLVEGEIFLI